MQSPIFYVSILVLFLPILIIILVLRLLAWWFCGTPKGGSQCFSHAVVCSWNSCPHVLPGPALIQGVLLCLTVSCFVLVGCHILDGCSFLGRK